MLKAFLSERYQKHNTPNVETWAMIVIEELESNLREARRRLEDAEKAQFRLDRNQ